MKTCNVRRLYDVVERIVEYTFGLETVPARKFYHDHRQFVFITETGLLYVLPDACLTNKCHYHPHSHHHTPLLLLLQKRLLLVELAVLERTVPISS
jgi:hypothetical protein